jgi:hypothetical protein
VGGGNWLDETWPDGAAVKGSGRVSMESNREDWHPAAAIATNANMTPRVIIN